MQPNPTLSCTAFAEGQRLARGLMPAVAEAVKVFTDAHPDVAVLVFDDESGQTLELDLRGSLADVLTRLAPAADAGRGPGRPRLGVVPREVTLLPRHWDWLATQPGGASVALRKLVEEARRTSTAQDARRLAQQVAYRFMVTIAGDRTGFEDAARALFASDAAGLAAAVQSWPTDIRTHLLLLAGQPLPPPP